MHSERDAVYTDIQVQRRESERASGKGAVRALAEINAEPDSAAAAVCAEALQ
jgi:hypothetical protein